MQGISELMATISETSPTTLGEFLGFVVFFVIGFIIVFSPEAVTVGIIQIEGIQVPESLQETWVRMIGLVMAIVSFGWLILTNYVKSSQELKEYRGIR